LAAGVIQGLVSEDAPRADAEDLLRSLRFTLMTKAAEVLAFDLRSNEHPEM